MVTIKETIRCRIDTDVALDAINRMAHHFETAPDTDPAKVAMAAFGEIEIGRDIIVEGGKDEGGYLVRATLSPALQTICDMVP